MISENLFDAIITIIDYHQIEFRLIEEKKQCIELLDYIKLSVYISKHSIIWNYRIISNYRMISKYRIMSDYRFISDYRIISNYGMILNYRIMSDYRFISDYRIISNYQIIWEYRSFIRLIDVHRIFFSLHYRYCRMTKQNLIESFVRKSNYCKILIYINMKYIHLNGRLLFCPTIAILSILWILQGFACQMFLISKYTSAIALFHSKYAPQMNNTHNVKIDFLYSREFGGDCA